MSSQLCTVTNCKRASRALCHCCNQNLCKDHFNEHDNLLNSQLNPLTDELNALADRLVAININKITSDAQHKLDQWRLDSYKIIDGFYEKKCQELNRCMNENIDKQRREISDLRSKMTELIEKQEATNNDIHSITSTIRNLEQNMNEIEHIHVQIDIYPLIIDNSLIQIGKSKVYQFDLLNLSSPYQMIRRTHDSYNSLASNNRFLLTHIDSHLCLIDENLSITKRKKWDYSAVEDLCWSSVLRCFIVVTEKGVLLIDENTMSIELVHQIETEQYWACGCSNKSLYLSRSVWDSSLLEFGLLPSIQFVKVWKTNNKINEKQRVDSIVYNHNTLALAINNQSNKAKFIELRSLENFSVLWSVQLNADYNKNTIRCCQLNYNGWLAADWSSSYLFQIIDEGKVKEAAEYTSTPYNLNLFHSNILVILTDESINFYKL